MIGVVSIAEHCIAKDLRGARMIGYIMDKLPDTEREGYTEWSMVVAWEREDQCGTHRVQVNSREESMAVHGHYDLDREGALKDLMKRAYMPTDKTVVWEKGRHVLTVPHPDGYDVRYEQHTDGTVMGYKVTRMDTGETEFIYFNPSDNDDGSDVPNVFVYVGPTGDPGNDQPLVHFVQFRNYTRDD